MNILEVTAGVGLFYISFMATKFFINACIYCCRNNQHEPLLEEE